jgi:lycopene epsilon-cyclase
MELLTQLDLAATDDFFRTFFALPSFYWRGFLGSALSSVQLLVFALLTFVIAPLSIKAKLVAHLAVGKRLLGLRCGVAAGVCLLDELQGGCVHGLKSSSWGDL